MPEVCPASAEEGTAAKMILQKPLQKLTEDDIAQLTREDCRRYLKEKGMRRPSWNKSQAIQQVIMLKSLLETAPDSATVSGKRLQISCTINSQGSKTQVQESVPTTTTIEDAENSVSAEEMTQHCQKDVEKPDSSAGFHGHYAPSNEECGFPRSVATASIPVDQMTIFYCGNVNVYDNIPQDKARVIMNIAASPVEEQRVDCSAMLQPPLTCWSKAASPKTWPDSAAAAILPASRIVKTVELGEEYEEHCHEIPGVEGSSNRKASVQRYLEKRKDRFKSKRKVDAISCSSLDVYSNRRIGDRQLPIPVCCGSSSSPSDSEMNVTTTTTACSSGLFYKGGV